VMSIRGHNNAENFTIAYNRTIFKITN
jgi:hypothetical protein